MTRISQADGFHLVICSSVAHMLVVFALVFRGSVGRSMEIPIPAAARLLGRRP